MAFSTGSSSSAAEINVTPLIDVLLVLLIIFMVISPSLPRGIDSALPQGKAVASVELPPMRVQVLAGKGGVGPRYLIDAKEAAFAEIRPVLEHGLAARQERAVFVEADRSLSFEDVAQVVGQARAAGAGPVALVKAGGER